MSPLAKLALYDAPRRFAEGADLELQLVEPAYRLRQILAGQLRAETMVIKFFRGPNLELRHSFPFSSNEGEPTNQRKTHATWAYGLGPVISATLNVWLHVLVWPETKLKAGGRAYTNKWPIFLVEGGLAEATVKAYNRGWTALADQDQEAYLTEIFEAHEAWRRRVLET